MGQLNEVNATSSAPLPLLMRELSFFLKLEKSVNAARLAEESAGVFACDEELAKIDHLCLEAQAKIGRALALAYQAGEGASHA